MASWRNNYGKGATEEMLDRENQRMTEGLAGKVGVLKQLAFDMKTEADEQNKFLGGMGTDFEASEGLLSGSVNRLSHMLGTGKNNRRLMCYLIAGLVGLFLFLYLILSKWRG